MKSVMLQGYVAIAVDVEDAAGQKGKVLQLSARDGSETYNLPLPQDAADELAAQLTGSKILVASADELGGLQ